MRPQPISPNRSSAKSADTHTSASSDRRRSGQPPDRRPLPQAVPAEHAAWQHLANDHRVAAGRADEPPAGGDPGRPELHVIPLVVSPPSGPRSIPRLVHLDPPRSIAAPPHLVGRGKGGVN